MGKFLTNAGLSHLWNTHIKPKLESKVDKVNGKGLSTNDLTNALKANYDAASTHAQSSHAPAGAQVNVIESIKVNGTALPVSNKAVEIETEDLAEALTNEEIDAIINGTTT